MENIETKATEATEISLQNGAKELSEVFVALEGVIKSMKEGAGIGGSLAANMEKFGAAFDNYKAISEEVKDKSVLLPTVGFHLGKIASLF